MNRVLFAIGILMLALGARAQEVKATAVVAPNEVRIAGIEAPANAVNPRLELWDGKTTRTQTLTPGVTADAKFSNLGLAPGDYTVYLVADNKKTGEAYIVGSQTVKTHDPLELVTTPETIKQFADLGVDLDALRRNAMKAYRVKLQAQLEALQAQLAEVQAAIDGMDAVAVDALPADGGAVAVQAEAVGVVKKP